MVSVAGSSLRTIAATTSLNAYLWSSPIHLENRLQLLTAYFPVMLRSRFVLVTFADNHCLVMASQADEKLFLIALPKGNVELTKHLAELHKSLGSALT